MMTIDDDEKDVHWWWRWWWRWRWR